MYQDDDLTCDLKCGEYEDQEHLLDCQILIDNCKELYEDSTVKYDDLFGSGTKQLEAVQLYRKVLKRRQELLANMSTGNNIPVQCTI